MKSMDIKNIMSELLVKSYKLNKKQKAAIPFIWHKLTPDIMADKKELDKLLAKTMKTYLHRGSQDDGIMWVPSIEMYKGGVPLDFKHGQWVGVEIECIMPFLTDEKGFSSDGETDHEGGELCQEGECDCPYVDSDDVDLDKTNELNREVLLQKLKSAGIINFEVKHDGSLDYESDSEFPVEVTFCFTRDNYHKLNKVLKVLNDLGAKVNSSCGLHVHLDMRQKTSGTITLEKQALINSLSQLVKFVPKSRRDNKDYCKINPDYLMPHSRYYAVNLLALKKFNTIEMRLHSGTTNFLKIKNWIDLLFKIKSNAWLQQADLKKVAALTSIDFMEKIELESNLVRWFLKREFMFESEIEEIAPLNNRTQSIETILGVTAENELESEQLILMQNEVTRLYAQIRAEQAAINLNVFSVNEGVA